MSTITADHRIHAKMSDRRHSPESLLCVVNFPANTGYAWDFIEALYAGVADRLAARGVATWVAYPEMREPPATLRDSAARPVELPVRLDDRRALGAAIDFIRARHVRVLYLSDRASWHPAYLALRLAGVRRIVVHDHSSGARTVPGAVKHTAKWLSRRVPGMLADEVIGVSDYVARRQTQVDLVPARRVRRMWNSIAIPEPDSGVRRRLRETLGVATGRPVVACACRAAFEKGVQHLLRAFDRVGPALPDDGRPALVYFGAGPHLDCLRGIRDALRSREDVIFTGYRADAADLVAGADVAVAPSLWQEAFGLAVLDAMARGVPVVASRVGGIPEIVVDGETGLLVTPGDERAIAEALIRLLSDPAERRRLGGNGRRRALECFARDGQLRELYAILAAGFHPDAADADA